MLTLNRSEALTFARLHYQALLAKVLEAVDEPAERDQVERLAAAWDEKLVRLAALGPTVRLDERSARILVRLTERIHSDRLTRDALVDWVDAFPDAVADLFPPSRLTYRLEDGPGAAAARAAESSPRRRPAKLALAA